MTGQLWGECPYCERRKRVTKADDLLYGHKNRGGFECWGSGVGPVDGTVRTAEPACPRPGPDVVDTYTDPALVTSEFSTTSWGWDVLYAFLWLGGVAAGFLAGAWWARR